MYVHTLATVYYLCGYHERIMLLYSFEGRRGRPKINITEEQFLFLRNKGFTAKEIASQLGCSMHFVYKFAKKTNNPFRKKYAAILEDDLRAKVSDLHDQFPNSGSVVSA